MVHDTSRLEIKPEKAESIKAEVSQGPRIDPKPSMVVAEPDFPELPVLPIYKTRSRSKIEDQI